MRRRMNYSIESIVEYAREHTIRECANTFDCSYQAMQVYLNRHKIKHLVESRKGSNNPRYKHGASNTRLFHIWQHIILRSYTLSNPHYKDYGGRGIGVCPEWRDFICFKEWAYSHGYTDKLTIDRIDNNKGYYPDNCRWTDYYTQSNNRRFNHLIEYKGVVRTLAQWSKLMNIPKSTLFNRLNVLGWSTERALLTESRSKK